MHASYKVRALVQASRRGHDALNTFIVMAAWQLVNFSLSTKLVVGISLDLFSRSEIWTDQLKPTVGCLGTDVECFQKAAVLNSST